MPADINPYEDDEPWQFVWCRDCFLVLPAVLGDEEEDEVSDGA
jgi:hypothetical protein